MPFREELWQIINTAKRKIVFRPLTLKYTPFRIWAACSWIFLDWHRLTMKQTGITFWKTVYSSSESCCFLLKTQRQIGSAPYSPAVHPMSSTPVQQLPSSVATLPFAHSPSCGTWSVTINVNVPWIYKHIPDLSPLSASIINPATHTGSPIMALNTS